ncbi:MAG TPA: AgmX/PglI C-terminal domain-containing protein [Polyangiaceae bacterium]|jgi:hypothetical protein
MLPRSLVRPVSACGVTAVLFASAVCAAGPPQTPPIPPVAEIPVAPLPTAKRLVPVATPPLKTTTTTTTTTTITSPTPATPSLIAVVPDEAPPVRGAAEAMPSSPLPAAPHVVLVDELPYRATHTRARELPEHAKHGKKKGRHGRPFHPAPGIVVDVVDAQGGASAADMQRLARSAGYWPFRTCYEEGLRRDQHLGGKVSMDLAVAPGGAVERSTLTGATLHDESVVLCVAREAKHLTLAPGESATAAKLEVTLSTGDEPVPVPHAAPHADELREALHASWPAVQQCYAGELARRPDVGGRLELRFRAKANGEIDEVSEGEPRFGDVDVTRCVLGVYRTARLPALHHGSHETTFVYAMHLEARPEPPAAR